MTPLVPYLIACVIVGFLGKEKRVGFWGFFLLAVFFTPVFALVVLILGMARKRNRDNERKT